MFLFVSSLIFYAGEVQGQNNLRTSLRIRESDILNRSLDKSERNRDKKISSCPHMI